METLTEELQTGRGAKYKVEILTLTPGTRYTCPPVKANAPNSSIT